MIIGILCHAVYERRGHHVFGVGGELAFDGYRSAYEVGAWEFEMAVYLIFHHN